MGWNGRDRNPRLLPKDYMYKVYWTEEQHNTCSADFQTLESALHYMETLRKAYEYVSHVVLSVENPHCTSLPGAVVATSKNYHWRKRRHF